MRDDQLPEFPTEIVGMILGHLRPTEVYRSGLVCKKWLAASMSVIKTYAEISGKQSQRSLYFAKIALTSITAALLTNAQKSAEHRKLMTRCMPRQCCHCKRIAADGILLKEKQVMKTGMCDSFICAMCWLCMHEPRGSMRIFCCHKICACGDSIVPIDTVSDNCIHCRMHIGKCCDAIVHKCDTFGDRRICGRCLPLYKIFKRVPVQRKKGGRPTKHKADVFCADCRHLSICSVCGLRSIYMVKCDTCAKYVCENGRCNTAKNHHMHGELLVCNNIIASCTCTGICASCPTYAECRVASCGAILCCQAMYKTISVRPVINICHNHVLCKCNAKSSIVITGKGSLCVCEECGIVTKFT